MERGRKILEFYIARFIIGVPIRTPICAILGDLGWRPFKFRSFISACKFWTRAIEMNKCRLVYQALCVQRNMYLKNKTCWLSKLYKSLRMSEYGLKVFDNFISINDFHGPCSRKEKKKMDKKVIEHEIRWEKDIEKEIYSWYDKIWWSDISISRQNKYEYIISEDYMKNNKCDEQVRNIHNVISNNKKWRTYA